MRFRHWLSEADKGENDIKHMLDSQGMILFFTKDSDVYGAGEGSRVIFAKLKNPSKDMADGWEDEASFTGHNIGKMTSGEPCTHVFGKPDIKKIKIIDQDAAVKKVLSKGKETPKADTIRIVKIFPAGQKDRDQASNMMRADEE